MKRAEDAKGIAELIRSRLNERYWQPVGSGSQSGFVQLAISCLLIEFFWSLKKGWKDSNHMSRRSFEEFFGESSRFTEIRRHANAFYTHVRCGLLHQAETTGGWKVSRSVAQKKLLDGRTKTIQAHRFFAALKAEIGEFLNQLATTPLRDSDWKPVLKKLDYIVANCR